MLLAGYGDTETPGQTAERRIVHSSGIVACMAISRTSSTGGTTGTNQHGVKGTSKRVRPLGESSRRRTAARSAALRGGSMAGVSWKTSSEGGKLYDFGVDVPFGLLSESPSDRAGVDVTFASEFSERAGQMEALVESVEDYRTAILAARDPEALAAAHSNHLGGVVDAARPWGGDHSETRTEMAAWFRGVLESAPDSSRLFDFEVDAAVATFEDRLTQA